MVMHHSLKVAILAMAAVELVAGQVPDIECAKGLQMFVSRGTGEEPGPGETGKLVEKVLDRIEGSQMLAIDYPASSEDPFYIESVANGTLTLRTTLEAYSQACPDTKVAVMGYSQVWWLLSLLPQTCGGLC